MPATVCPQCGTIITNKDVCTACGTRLKSENIFTSPVSLPKSTSQKKSFFLHHYLVLIAGFFLVTFLYNLPRHVIDTNRNLSSDLEGKQQNNSSVDEQTVGKMPLLPETILNTDTATVRLIREMEKEYEKEINKDDKLKLAENLSKAYVTINYFKAAAPVLWNIAIEKKDAQSWFLAARAFQDANSSEKDSTVILENQNKSQLALNKTLRVDPGYTDAKIDLALIYMNGSQPMQGISLLREVIEKDPANEKAGFYLGIFSMKTGQYDKAISRFETLMLNHPENLEVYYYQALAYYYFGNPEKSVPLLAQIKEKSSDPHLLAITGQLENMIKGK